MCKKIKFKNHSFTSFCLKLAVLGKIENYTAEIWNSTSLLLPGLASNPVQSANFPVFPGSSLLFCPPTHIFSSSLPSPLCFSLAGTITGFEHLELQSQPSQFPWQEGAQWHWQCTQQPCKGNQGPSRFASAKFGVAGKCHGDRLGAGDPGMP